MVVLTSASILIIAFVIHPPTAPPKAPPTVKNTLVYGLTNSETRTILPVQIKLPDGTWSQPVKYNFDTGASFPTDVAPQLLSAFGYGPDGVGDNPSLKKSNPEKSE